MIRAVIDSNGVDPIIDLPGALDAVAAAVRRGDLALRIPLAAVGELEATRDEKRRGRLLEILQYAEVAADGAFIVGRSAVGMARVGDPDIFAQLRAGNEDHVEDALIAMAALYEGTVLVTNEVKQLANRAARIGVECVTTVELLRWVGYEPADQNN